MAKTAYRSLAGMVLLLLHSSNLYSEVLRQGLPESWVPFADKVMMLVDTASFVIAILVIAFAALYTYYEADSQKRNPEIVERLQGFYEESEPLTRTRVSNDEELQNYKQQVAIWHREAQEWIKQNMTNAAASRFRDTSNILPMTYDTDYNNEYGSYRNMVNKLRSNLIELINSGEWDK